MSEVGSDEWIERFASAVGDVDPGAVPITVLHRIADGPSWVLRADATGVSVAAVDDGSPPDADVTFTWQRADADAVARGEVSALVAFQAGRLRVGGDLTRLGAVTDLFSRFPAVRADA